MFQPQIQETEQIKKEKKKLWIIFIISCVLIVLKFFSKQTAQIGVNEILHTLILLYSIITLNQCTLVFYIILALFNYIMLVQIMGMQIQKRLLVNPQYFSDKENQYVFAVILATMIFNAISFYYCFRIYKVFKIQLYDRGGSTNNYSPLEQPSRDLEESISKKKSKNQNQFNAFKGKGMKIGKQIIIQQMDLDKKEECKYVFKFIVVGSVAVGKTSLVNQFLHEEFVPTHLATLGVDLGSKIINISGQKVKLIIWDTAGSEEFRSLTRSYYRAVAGILLIYDITNEKSFEQLNFWLEECNKNSNNNVSIFLLGNKSDLNDKRRVTFAEAQVFSNKHNLKFLETSAKTSENVSKAFLELSNQIYTKIQKNEIDVYDKESGARFSEDYLKKIQDPNYRENDDQLLGGCMAKKSSGKNCCNQFSNSIHKKYRFEMQMQKQLEEGEISLKDIKKFRKKRCVVCKNEDCNIKSQVQMPRLPKVLLWFELLQLTLPSFKMQWQIQFYKKNKKIEDQRKGIKKRYKIFEFKFEKHK